MRNDGYGTLAWNQSFLPVRARKTSSAFRPRHVQRDCGVPVRMLAAEASETTLNRQVFWLTAPDGLERPSRGRFENCRSGTHGFEGLAEYSGGPATDSHRF